MSSFLRLGLLGTALTVLALPALAQQSPAPEAGRHGPPAMRLFQEADTSRDGRVTEAEAMDLLATRFAQADADRSGGVSRAELGDFLRSQFRLRHANATPSDTAPPRAQARLDGFFRAADANGDGQVTLEELRPLALAAFRAADRNGDGALEPQELRGRHR